MIQNSATTCKALCETRNVSHDFKLPNGSPLRVLEGINICVKPNEVVALLGPSGCGKSTILRILAGLIKPTQGEVFYHDEPMPGQNPGAAIVFQSFALYPWMTVKQNIEIVLTAAGMPPEQIGERTTKVIQTVSLTGFEDAYPRELSGGMKQRVGIARALSVDPEVLFMDEPFSAIDALTAESLRAEVIDLWSAKDKNPSSILMVSHDIKEVVYMADRIIVLSANPGRVSTVVENTLPRPRDYRSPGALRLVDQLHDIITGHEMPDAPPPAKPTVTGIFTAEPVPFVPVGEIVGLLEYLDARGGKEEVFKIAADTNHGFGQVMSVAKAAEMLEFVDTPKRIVILDTEGVRYVKASPEERKAIFRQQMMKLAMFKEIVEMVQRNPEKELQRDSILETIVLRMPYQNYERVFETMIRWARYAGVLTYDKNRQVVGVRAPKKNGK